ncbi:hypothetical protein [Desulfofundulus salinus]|uniref:hypothetical protein n=1 Tax=Desulfofundulus salinus TaxID=2419843 RepID=UPI001402CB1F|nr:hypothetical protein [Desulfofundulus salinum]
MSDIKKYVLDTSALLTYYQDEAADLIEEVFQGKKLLRWCTGIRNSAELIWKLIS